MAVLITAKIPGGSREMMAGNQPLIDKVKDAPGFVLHANGPMPGGWQIVEIWDSREQFDTWFQTEVAPSYPEDGPTPDVTFEELDQVVSLER